VAAAEISAPRIRQGPRATADSRPLLLSRRKLKVAIPTTTSPKGARTRVRTLPVKVPMPVMTSLSLRNRGMPAQVANRSSRPSAVKKPAMPGSAAEVTSPVAAGSVGRLAEEAYQWCRHGAFGVQRRRGSPADDAKEPGRTTPESEV
jgi:hypothetical protein